MELVIIGAGAHGRIVAETAARTGQFQILGFADDNPAMLGVHIGKWRVLGPWSEIPAEAYIIAIGNNAARQATYEKLQTAGKLLATIVSSQACVSDDAVLGAGSVVLPGAVVQSGARIGLNAIINAGAVVDHDAVIGDYAHVGANATVSCFGVVAACEFLFHAALRSQIAYVQDIGHGV